MSAEVGLIASGRRCVHWDNVRGDDDAGDGSAERPFNTEARAWASFGVQVPRSLTDAPER